MRKQCSSAAASLILLCQFSAPAFADELQDAISAAGSAAGPAAAALKSGSASLGTIEEYVAKHPKDAAARFELAKSYINMKQGELAEEQLRACMELAPIGSELHNNCIASLRQISELKFAGKNSVPGNQRSLAPNTNADTSSVSTSSRSSTTWSRSASPLKPSTSAGATKSIPATAAIKSSTSSGSKPNPGTTSPGAPASRR